MSFIHSFYQKLKIIFQNDLKEICLVKNSFDGELCVIKLQYNSNQGKKSSPRTVLHEGKFLQAAQGYSGIPFMYWAGRQETTGLAILIVERLGKTVEDLYKQDSKYFSLKTVCQIGISLIKMVHSYHDKGYTHGNLKLSSIQFGVGKKCNLLFFNDLIDSGLYIKKGRHIKQRQYIRKTRVHQFLSIDRLQGYQGSRRDDIESIIYILIFLIKQSLPWSQIFEPPHFNKNLASYEQSSILKDESISKEQTKQETIKFNKLPNQNSEVKYNDWLSKIVKKIEKSSVEQICEGTPQAFKKILYCCKSTEFEQKPDYNKLIRTLEKALEERGLQNDGIYDWMLKTENRLILKRQQFKDFGLKLANEKQILQNCYDKYQKNVELS